MSSLRNHRYYIKLFASFFGFAACILVPSSALSVVVVTSNITGDTTWGPDATANPDSVYRINGNIAILNATLTVQQGVRVEFTASSSLEIGGSSTRGSLQAIGTAVQPIRFTGTTKMPGHWNVLLFRSGSDLNGASSRMEHCFISYGGHNTTYAALVACENTTTPTMIGCVFELSSTDGLYLIGSNISVSQTTFREIARRALDIPAPSVQGVAGNVLVPKAGAPNVIYVRGGTINTSTTWPVPSPGFAYEIRVNEDIFVEGQSGPVVTLLPGTSIRHNNTSIWRIGRDAPGGLRAIGGNGAGEKVVFTSVDPVGAPGQWSGIEFHDQAFDGPTLVPGSAPPYSILEHVEIAYAGLNALGAVRLLGAAPRLSKCLIRDCATAGVYASGIQAKPHVRFSRFERNNEGIHAQENARPYVTASCFMSNSSYGIFCAPFDDGRGDMEARFCWWNSSTGPSGMTCNMTVGTGDAVTDHVRFCPFETTPVCELPTDTALQVAPMSLGLAFDENPAHGDVRFAVRVPATIGNADLTVYDMAGRKIWKTTINGTGETQAVMWAGRTDLGDRAPSGVYMVRLNTGQGQRLERKLVYLTPRF